MEWLKRGYNATGRNLYQAIQNQPGDYGIKASRTLNHRYITEDVPMSLVPIAAIGVTTQASRLSSASAPKRGEMGVLRVAKPLSTPPLSLSSRARRATVRRS
jgi:hypothetical protein